MACSIFSLTRSMRMASSIFFCACQVSLAWSARCTVILTSMSYGSAFRAYASVFDPANGRFELTSICLSFSPAAACMRALCAMSASLNRCVLAAAASAICGSFCMSAIAPSCTIICPTHLSQLPHQSGVAEDLQAHALELGILRRSTGRAKARARSGL